MNLRSLNKLVINLPERKERLEQFSKQMNYDFTVIPGVRHTNPMLGIAQAHINAIKYAKEQNWGQVLIMEDDLILRKGAEEYLDKALQYLPENWDILLGGVYNLRGKVHFNEYWDKAGEFCGLHFYIINSKSYDTVDSYNKRQHIDRWLNLKGDRLNCYLLKKFIATQANGFSDNRNKPVNYEDMIKQFNLL